MWGTVRRWARREPEPAPEPKTKVYSLSSKRGVGYCMAENCMEKGKRVFMLPFHELQKCSKCFQWMRCVPEVAEKVNQNPIYREIRVEYDYRPDEDRYAALAIVRDEDPSIPPDANVLMVRSPLISTDKRALVVAENLLSYVQLVDVEDGNVPFVREMLVDLAAPRTEVAKQLEKLDLRLKSLRKVQLAKS